MKKNPLIVGNWKMELSYKAGLEVMRSLKKLIQVHSDAATVVVCPSYPALDAIASMIKKDGVIQLGAQNIHYEEKGAYTGLVSVHQIRDFVSWCIIGHSEQREYVGETDEQVLQKVHILQKHGIHPIVCVGETSGERSAGRTIEKISAQMEVMLSHIDRTALTKLVIAYEPIWAIGTGEQPTPDDVYEVILLIRKMIANRFDKEIADRVMILYGGSVKPDNVAGYIGGPGADGVLVGGASVHPKDFADIVTIVEQTYNS